jgi:signal transduction histidine kinase
VALMARRDERTTAGRGSVGTDADGATLAGTLPAEGSRRDRLRRGASRAATGLIADEPLGREAGLLRRLTPRYLWGVVLLALMYYGSARFGYAFGFAGPIGAIVWLPVGVSASFLTIRGLWYWPGALVGDLLANDYSALPLSGAIGQTIGNLLEVLVIAACVRWLMRRRFPLETIGGVVGMVGAIFLGTAVSATVGPLSLAATRALSLRSVPHISWTWWLGDTCGALLLLPLALAWYRPRLRRPSRRRALEALGVLGLVAVLSWISARGITPGYVIFPALALASIRFMWRGATTAVAVSVAFVVWGETHHNGHYAFDSITRSVIQTQLFILVAAIASLCWTALVAERDDAVTEMRASEARAFDAAESERRRMERDLHDGAQQRLLALAIRLRLGARDAASAPLRGLLADAEAELDQAIEELRDLSHGIHPSVLSELGLANAVRTLAGRSPIPVTLRELPTGRVDAHVQAAIYYVLTEALANAIKHSHASSIRLGISCHNGSLRLGMEDDGVGGASEVSGSGLAGMRERTEALGGTFRVESPRGLGTRILAVVPTGAA